MSFHTHMSWAECVKLGDRNYMLTQSKIKKNQYGGKVSRLPQAIT